MRTLPLVLVLACVACGADEKSETPAPEAQTAPVSAPATEAPSETPPTAQAPQTSSFLVQDPKELPACDESRRGALGYAFSSKAFYACNGQAWLEIDVKGEKGEKGDRGEKGDPGASVAAEEPAEEELGEAEWKDPVTGLVWLVAAHGDLNSAKTTCQGNYELPSSQPLAAAAKRGLYSRARAIYGDNGPAIYGWTTDNAAQGIGIMVTMTGDAIGKTEQSGVTAARGIYCLRK